MPHDNKPSSSNATSSAISQLPLWSRFKGGVGLRDEAFTQAKVTDTLNALSQVPPTEMRSMFGPLVEKHYKHCSNQSYATADDGSPDPIPGITYRDAIISLNPDNNAHWAGDCDGTRQGAWQILSERDATLKHALQTRLSQAQNSAISNGRFGPTSNAPSVDELTSPDMIKEMSEAMSYAWGWTKLAHDKLVWAESSESGSTIVTGGGVGDTRT